jgi:hypothetical protein
MSQASLWATLESYGIPDVDLLKSLYEHVCLPERDMGIVKITFNTGVVQGSVLSPLLFPLFINVMSLYLSDIGRKKRIHHVLPGTHPFNHILFTDDMTLLEGPTSPRIVTGKQHIKTYVDEAHCTVNTFIHKHPKSPHCPLIPGLKILLESPFH